MAHPARVVANEFITRGCDEERPLTPLQIMKLVYYAHGWMLALCDRPLVEESFRAWAYGPVIPDLYHAMKHYGAQPVNAPLPLLNKPLLESGRLRYRPLEPAGLDEQQTGIIDATYTGYGHLHGLTLMEISHDGPWEDARRRRGRSNPISNTAIKKYFKAKLHARTATP